ncbi:hypothetical protein [Antrihabitans sp. YC2-6]|uniref:hypothetical protein n=1 Tax=Antrihabitans sp. YC2-6 TaxID=2799498 RepID=UPI0018F5624E|nr:hypothetical protein [Antrihabitans sp. YC2-6]MBJ8344989.1 hypothetical protein [Antrihabitans sp. YC2-6]
MELNQFTTRLRDDLLAAAALGDDKTKATAEALANAAESSARLMLLTALSAFAQEVSDALGDRTVHVRLDGTDAVVDVARKPADKDREAFGNGTRHAAEDAFQSFEDLTGDISRVTLRLVEQMKARAEEAAAESGQSLNSWMSNAVQGALRDQWRKNSKGWQNY